MTATSLRNALPFRNALRVVNDNKKMTIVTCILQLLGIPLVVAALMLELIADSHSSKDGMIYSFLDDMDVEIYAGIGAMLAGAAIFMGMFAAINSFAEMYKKTKVDMLYALPLTGTQRYFSNYLGGCLMYIVPYIIAVLLGWGLLLGLSPFVQWGETFAQYDTFAEFMGEVGKYYAMGTAGLLVLMLLYYSLAVLVTVCCGTLFESIYTNILLNCLIPGTVALIIASVTNAIDMDFEYSWYCIGFMSPIGGLIYLIMLLTGEMNVLLIPDAYNFRATQTTSHEMFPSYLRWVFAILLLTAAMVAGAWFLYKRRKSEETGKPFVYVLAYYLMLTLGTMAILCLSAVDDDFIGPAIFFAAIVYFVMEVIRKRGFRKFWLSVVTFISTVVVSFGLYALVVTTDGFGRTNYVPAAINVSSVRVEYTSNESGYRNFSYALEYTDREVISEIVKLHHDVVSDRKGDSGSKIYQTRWAADLNAQMLSERWAELTYDRNQGIMYTYDLPYRTTDDIKESESYNFGTDRDAYFPANYRTWLDPASALPEGIEGAYTNAHTLELTYYTRTGSTVHRAYSLTSDEMQRIYGIVRGTELYAKACSDGLYARFVSEYASYDNKLRRSAIPSSIQFKMGSIANDNNFRYAENTVYMTDAPAKLRQIADAYKNDLSQMTAEDFRTSEVYGYLCQVPVYEACRETVALLEQNGLRAFTAAEKMAINDTSNQISGIAGNMGVLIFRPEDNRTASVDYPHSTAADIYFHTKPAYEDAVYGGSTIDLQKSYPELYALLNAARSNYVTAENCYVLYFDGDAYIIPEADSDLAEAVIAKGDGYYLEKTVKTAASLGWDSSNAQDYFD